MNTRGFTLVELLMGMTLMAILGIGLTRILISDSRFVSRQDAMMSARQGARQAMNTMVSEMAMITDGGLLNATPKLVTLRVPYAWGVLCRYAGAVTTASLLPVDSLTYASAVLGGAAYRNSKNVNDVFQFPAVTSISVSSPGTASQCTADSIRLIPGTPGGKIINITTNPAPVASLSGQIFYLYQNVTYAFTNSLNPAFSGRKALFREIAGLTPDELVVPFDTSAGFRCLIMSGANLVAVTCPPAGGVNVVKGFELKLVSASDKPPQGMKQPERFNLTTRVVFNNR
jgi:prepilin-type N-terminal cleavage/methylation domain-containing protein